MNNIQCGTGALIDPPDERNWQLAGLATDVEVPNVFELNLPFKAKWQGAVKPTCVSCACAAIKEYQEDTEEMSGEFIYWRALEEDKATKTSGMYFVDACKTMQKTGELMNKYFPTDPTEWKSPILSNWSELCKKNKIKYYAKCGLTKEELKKAIFQFGPILIGVYATNFKTTAVIKMKNGTRSRVSDGIIIPFISKGNPHAVVAYGYNEKGLLIRNWATIKPLPTT